MTQASTEKSEARNCGAGIPVPETRPNNTERHIEILEHPTKDALIFVARDGNNEILVGMSIETIRQVRDDLNKWLALKDIQRDVKQQITPFIPNAS